VPGSAITTSVNIDQVRITGIESVLEVRPTGRLSGYLNVALNHAYGIGPITGGFFPEDNPPGYFDLDHDQRISALATVNYADRRLFLSATGSYGSGLTNGADPDSTYGRGLFDFNRSIKVAPAFILGMSAGYLFTFGGVFLRPELYVDNVLDHKYLLKGAFFSGASVGRPRTVVVRLNASV
jgi:outer membrane receptor protein involved in Fe transport